MLEKPVVQTFIEMAHKHSLPAKHTLIHAGDTPQSIYLMIEGSVSILLEDDNGREIVLAYLGAGEFFGEIGLFPDQGVRTAIVRTRAPTLVAELDYTRFRQFTKHNPEIMFELAGQLACRLRDTTRRVGDLTFLDVAGRMARPLLDLIQKPDASPHKRGTLIRVSRQELARLIGCSREMSGRVLKTLEDDGMIINQGRSIIVLGHGLPKKPQ